MRWMRLAWAAILGLCNGYYNKTSHYFCCAIEHNNIYFFD